MAGQGFARVVTLAGASAAMVWAAHAAPVHPQAPAARASSSSPVRAASVVCPGGAGETTLSVASSAQRPAGTQAAGSARTTVAGGRESLALALGGQAQKKLTGGPVVVEAQGALAPGLVASQVTATKDAVSARTCAVGSDDAWIAAGDHAPEMLLTLVLVNTGSRAASVDVDVRASDGDVAGAAITDKAVPAHARVEVNLPTDATAHSAPVVHVRSEGGAVQASVRDSASSGAHRGEELTAQYTDAATTQVLPAVPVTAGRTRVRLATPGAVGAVVRLRALDPAGGASREMVVTLRPGRTLDAEMTGLPGRFTAIRATSDTPIVAAATTPSAEKNATDFAWAPAAPDVLAHAGAALAGVKASGTLVLATDGPAVTALVVVTSKDGRATRHRVVVPARAAARLEIPEGGQVWLDAPVANGRSHLHAGVVLRGSGHDSGLTTAVLTPVPWLRQNVVAPR